MTSEQRNADSPQADDQRNANAERQRRYRDRKRGGPPVGRWAGGMSAKQAAKQLHVGRTSLFMSKWIQKYAPDCVEAIEQGGIKVSPTYKRLRAEYAAGLQAAIEQAHRAGIDTEQHRLTVRRERGKFVFEWM